MPRPATRADVSCAAASAGRFWAELTTGDFTRLDLQRTTAVLPLGATEQHGPHLPLCVDTTLVNGVVAACLPHLPAELPALFVATTVKV